MRFVPRFHAPHTIRPDLRLLEPHQPLLHHDEQLLGAISEKLVTPPEKAILIDRDNEALDAAVCTAIIALAASLESPLSVDTTGGVLMAFWHQGLGFGFQRKAERWVPFYEETCLLSDELRILLERRNYAMPSLWANLGLLLQEDMALMHWRGEPDHEALVAQALHVSFPSGWLPAEKIGKRLLDLHAPVADGDLLRRASDPLGHSMISRGPFERFVWTLTHDARRARRPGDAQAAERNAPIFLRWERQTTLPMPAHQCTLFLIRVYVEPLEAVVKSEQQMAELKASLASMSDALIAYKGLAPILKQLGIRQT